MSQHIAAQPGEIAETVLLAGDPLRARFIAETYLEDAHCYTKIRNMFGFTGYYKGKRLSIQGSGMGMPSMAIYGHELITHYKVQNLIRIGSCGSLQADIPLRSLVLAQGACTDSNFNRLRFHGMDFAPLAAWPLLKRAEAIAGERELPVLVGNVFSTDNFYREDLPAAESRKAWEHWANFGVLVVEMETAALYTLAAGAGVQALSILTVSDHLPTEDLLSIEEREKGFRQMAELGLEVAKSISE